MTDVTLTTRQLNRALLARQFLLERVPREPFEVIEHLAGMQAQVPQDPYLALWSRLDPFDPAEVERLMVEREVGRSPSLRGTIHLATAQDCLDLRALVQPVLTRAQRGAFGKRLAGADLDALAAEGLSLLQGEPITFAQLRARLSDRWDGFDGQALSYSISYFVPLVQVPPRGLWSKSGLPTWTTTEAWFGRKLPKRPSIDTVVLRYLGAFGPASAADVQAWCGLTRMGEVLERLRKQLVTFRSERGVELFDLPDAPRPDADTPAPPRVFPQYDNFFLGHADRSRIGSEAHRVQAVETNGYVSMLAVDGFIAATWRLERAGKHVEMQIAPFEPWPKATRNEVTEEATRALAFLSPKAATREVVLAS